MICEEGSESLCVAAIEVVQEIMDEKVDIGRERSTWLTGYKPLPPQLEVIVGVEPDEPENISDLEKLQNPQTTLRKPVKVGRNDPCPCGSGRKYKKCCGTE